jgi:peptidoglycan/xylan/chitin deacetylase (PgdA/CDA1 family)
VPRHSSTKATKITKATKLFRVLSFVAFVCFVTFVLKPWPVTAQSSKTLALTFDDLPKAQGFADYGGTKRTTQSILKVLKAHHAPAVAFVNEQKLYDAAGHLVPERVSVLKMWADGGVILGNHTYSHIDLDKVTLEQYQNDIIKGERTWPRLMRGHSTEKWFRQPFTHTGSTQAIKDGLDKFLSRRGYRVAPFTIENSDWMFSAVYAQAVFAGDDAQAKKVRDAYLSYSDTMFDWFEGLAKDTFGHTIPQVLLIHSNELHTEALDALLTTLEKRGYRFVTLAQAMRDPAYATPDGYVGANGPSWLHRWRVTKNLPARLKDEPDPPQWIVDAAK